MSLPKLKLTKTHYLIIAVVVVLFLVWRIVSVVFFKPVTTKEIPVVRTVTINSASTDNSYTYPGEVRGKYESNLAFQVAGKIVSRQVSVGDKVSAGEVLLTIDPKDVQQNLTAKSAAVTSAQATANLAEDNFARYSTLYSKGAVSQMVYDQYRTQYEAAQAALNAAQAQLNAAENQLGYTQLVADHDGSITALNGEIGQVVAAGTPLVSIVQDGSREVQIFVPENRLGQVKPGQAAIITFWALGDLQAKGHISEIAPMADSTTRTYKVRVAVDEMPDAARLGMTAKVTLQSGSGTALLLPSSSVYQTNDQTGVWVVRDGKVNLVPVTVAGYEGNNIKITTGLASGDVVVTGGGNKLAEGMEVRLESASAQKGGAQQ